MLLQLRDCVKCPAQFPTCPACPSGQTCELRLNTCDQCAVAVCLAAPSVPASAGPDPAAIAGGVVGGVVFLAIIGAVVWYRRRQRQSTLLAKQRATVDTKDVVARAETVLNRPDPTEKPTTQPEEQEQQQQSTQVFHSDSATINLAPLAQNPFSDHASINTASDRATNVIPIAYVPPSSSSALTSITDTTNSSSRTPSSVAASTITPPARPVSTQTGQSGPIRPQRGPEIEDMRLNISRPVSETPSDLSSLAPPKVPYARSTASGISGVSSRTSIISASSSILNEAPQIVTSMQANFRQVLGVQKAEVIQLSSSAPSSPGLSAPTPRTPQTTSARSPLAQMAFTAGDIEEGTETGPESKAAGNPFADPTRLPPASPTPTATFGVSVEDDSRPNSIVSTNGTIIANIGNATRVQVLKSSTGRSLLSTVSASSASPITSPHSPDFRTAGQLSPPAQGVPRSFDDDMSRRISQSTVATSHRTSTADSILEAFPFVPPSPISMHHTSNPSTPLAQRGFAAQQEKLDREQLTPPNRQLLGMSVMSATSTTSSGLGGYSFQFGASSPALPPSPVAERTERASLDTLALSRDLEAFPLPYDSPASPRSSTPFVTK